jgi:N4-(beta-N-acetylglucosaminyl)-L-asparaginase
MIVLFLLLITYCIKTSYQSSTTNSLVINTWGFSHATDIAWNTLTTTQSTLDSIEQGVHQCEIDQCDHTVGYGGSPNDNGETTLDAMIMCGKTRRVGSVANLKNIKAAVKVARRVMTDTYHTLLVGSDAMEFALKVGFQKEDLSTNFTRQQYDKWVKDGGIPNYWRKGNEYNLVGHDTIGMVVINDQKDVACGTSTNGVSFRIAGRVGDSSMIGSGAYCENLTGGCAATGNGDVIMRFLPAYHAVMLMKYFKMHPKEASRIALDEITKYYSEKTEAIAGLICANIKGEVGAAAIGSFRNGFAYTLRNSTMTRSEVFPWNV